jgi:5'-phosphate synthase pdxT subunit
MILLSEGRLGTMKIRVRRNAYGRQLGSFHAQGLVDGVGENIPMTFIRAPYIEEILQDNNSDKENCRPLAVLDGHVVAAEQGRQLVTSFHPELDGDTRMHAHFLQDLVLLR